MDLLRTFSFGQYVPVESVIHRLDPRTKILGTLVLAVVAFLARGFWDLAAYAAVLAVVVLAARISPGYLLRGLRPVFWLLAFTVALLHSPQGELNGIVAVIRDETVRFQEERALKKRITELEAQAQQS